MNINIIYHHFPHYRAPVMRELVLHGMHKYRCWGSLKSFDGVKAFQGDDVVSIHPLRFRFVGKIWMLGGYWPAVLDRSADALIVLATPNMPACWVISLAARILGKKVLYWCHGWLRPEPPLKRMLRNLFYRFADCVLVYSERSKILGIQSGYPAKRIKVIYNSVGLEPPQLQMESVMKSSDRPQGLFAEPDRPLIICTARLTARCRFDILLAACKELAQRGQPVNVVLVGEGAERKTLEEMARTLTLSVHFYGPCYDEDKLAGLIYWSDLTVSPGKIGLTAIHSLLYGTPVITHSDFNAQMPEVEAIVPGVTGLLFERNNAQNLADQIQAWLAAKTERGLVREACKKVVAAKWNPKRQRILIDQAVSEIEKC